MVSLPVGGIGITVEIIKMVAQPSLVDSIRDGVLTTMSDIVKGVASEEVSKKIDSLRSDGRLKKQLQDALETAVQRWIEKNSDPDLLSAVAKNTRFTDLASVKNALRTAAMRPFDSTPAVILSDEFYGVLPKSFPVERVEKSVQELLAFVQEEFRAVPALKDIQQLALTKQIADHTLPIKEIEKILLRIEESLKSRPASPEMDIARFDYLDAFNRRSQYLPLSQLGNTADLENEITLDKVYITLNTRTEIDMEEGEKRPLTALEAAQKNPRMVLLGDPGSGKSTFARKFLASQAQACLQQTEPLNGIPADLLPVMVLLRDIAPRLEKAGLAHLEDKKAAAAFYAALESQALEDLQGYYCVPEFCEGMKKALRSGQVLLVLDGLDEVHEDARRLIRDHVWDFVKNHDVQHLLITCRVRSYTGEAVMNGFTPFTLANLNQEQINDFSQAWYNAQLENLGKSKVAEKVEDLQVAIRREPRILSLAENPLLLTVIASIHQADTQLPNQRVVLYRRSVELLLERWQKDKGNKAALSQNEALNVFLNDSKNSGLLRSIMERLAYEAHKAGMGKEEADLERMQALEILDQEEYLNDLSLAQAFLDYANQRAGLLMGRGGSLKKPMRYTFPHRTFQEYLAGCYLFSGRTRDISPRLLQHAAEEEYWNLAVELGAEEILYSGKSKSYEDLLDIANDLLSSCEDDVSTSQRPVLWAGKIASLISEENIRRDKRTGPVFLNRLCPGLVTLFSSELTPPERADAGRALAKLGDSRPEVLDVDSMQFCFVPGGDFEMGSDPSFDGFTRDDEKLIHRMKLPSFWMGRFPVTNAQFNAFVRDGGYELQEFWAEAAQAGFWKEGCGVKRRGDEAYRLAPVNYAEPFNLANHPVVGVSWYEALAFTRWLEKRWHAQGLLPVDWKLRLPSEAEWEKAARGGLETPLNPVLCAAQALAFAACEVLLQPNPLPRRIYPYGDTNDPSRGNTRDSGVNATSALGCFPSGESPYGAEDMSGNVWEWTRSLGGPYPYVSTDGREDLDSKDRRVLRGGAFDLDQVHSRCAYRHWYLPLFRDFDRGFRPAVFL
ncbi:MAG: SUMF1/EgtB/PvdO family nonheme iron enzyme [Chloroflexota bacterium]